MKKLCVKRIYETPATADGYRVLVDRVWPRGMKREKAGVDAWLKEIAPSTALRKWFDHDPAKWAPFCEKYFEELTNNPALEQLYKYLHSHHQLTLLYSAKDEQHNQAIALLEYLRLHPDK
ncbi:DUF488 domain-containing protein [Chitinophaga pendula]|uniref:DUF488 domain-containing protein n=1 Tax=Chitinophaga TaxID=79328 RepID=UPI000BB0B103|nr:MULTISPECIES: DUF488 domain-containing protein [Chitinophaga]ASZ12209.1 hypothetical protein CK934_15190 [Chitinophaga sp. MD30]UCJ04761.1 DUF488 domain-containing protein [Chitinophaga pendula]